MRLGGTLCRDTIVTTDSCADTCGDPIRLSGVLRSVSQGLAASQFDAYARTPPSRRPPPIRTQDLPEGHPLPPNLKRTRTATLTAEVRPAKKISCEEQPLSQTLTENVHPTGDAV